LYLREPNEQPLFVATDARRAFRLHNRVTVSLSRDFVCVRFCVLKIAAEIEMAKRVPLTLKNSES
jgi:hypothetical protein